ncbi:MAG: host attachment protein [Gammaproteobacteria bacterium]
MSNRKKIYVLVANASEATCYETEHLGHEMTVVKQYTHPESRQKAADLVSDDFGRYHDHSTGIGEPYEHVNPKSVEEEKFALELTDVLASALAKGLFGQWVLCASPHFLGLMKKHLGRELKETLAHSLEKDYTKLKEQELREHLKELLRFRGC